MPWLASTETATFAYDAQQRHEDFFVLAQVRERRHVNLRNHHDVYRPERLRVVKRQHGLSLGNHVNSSAPAEDLVAVEIASHRHRG